MEHRIDVQREKGKVTIIYQGKVVYARPRSFDGLDEQRESEADLHVVAQWLLNRGHADKRDLVTFYDEQSLHGVYFGFPYHAVVGRLAASRRQ
jgi:hypothetical protein